MNLSQSIELTKNIDLTQYITEINEYPISLKKFNQEIKNNKQIALFAVSKCSFCLEYVSEELQDDEEVVRIAITRCGFALKYASDRLKDDESIVELAMTSHVPYLCFASPRLIENENMISKLYERIKFYQLPKNLRMNDKIKHYYEIHDS